MDVVLSFCSICPLVAYFLKKNYSLRQNILKNMRVWERSLTLVPIGVYLDLIQVRTWLGTGSAKELWRFAGKGAPDAAPDAAVQRPVSSQEVNCCWRSDRTLRFSVRSCDEDEEELTTPTCVRSWITGRVRSWFQRNWTSLESTGRWVVVSGHYHRSVRLVDLTRLQDSFSVSFFVASGYFYNWFGRTCFLI